MCLPLLEPGRHVEHDLALLQKLVGALGSSVNTPTTPMPPVERTDLTRLFSVIVGMFVALRVVRLVADALAAAVARRGRWSPP